MFSRPTLRAGVTTIAAAVVLVGAANLGAYAATGQPLILGHTNSAVGTTTLRNAGRGPALSLKNARSVPPLAVTSTKVVKHLNAAMVGGESATALNGYLQYHVGGEGQVLGNAEHLFTAQLPPGNYYWTLTGLWTSGTTSDAITCLIFDKRIFTDPSNTQYVYGLFQRSESDPDAPFIQQAGFAHLTKGQTLVLGCDTSSDTGPVKTVHPVDFTFHPVIVEPRHGPTFTGKHAVLDRIAGR